MVTNRSTHEGAPESAKTSKRRKRSAKTGDNEKAKKEGEGESNPEQDSEAPTSADGKIVETKKVKEEEQVDDKRESRSMLVAKSDEVERSSEAHANAAQSTERPIVDIMADHGDASTEVPDKPVTGETLRGIHGW